MKKANRLITGFMGGIISLIVSMTLDTVIQSFWLHISIGIPTITLVLFVCDLISKKEYSGTWINGVKYDLDGIEICSFPQKDGSVDYTVGYASHRQLLTKEQAEDFKNLVESLKTGAN